MYFIRILFHSSSFFIHKNGRASLISFERKNLVPFTPRCAKTNPVENRLNRARALLTFMRIRCSGVWKCTRAIAARARTTRRQTEKTTCLWPIVCATCEHEYIQRMEPGVPKVPRGVHDPLVYTHADRARWYDVALLWGRVWGSSAGSCNLIPTMHQHKKVQRKDHRGFVAWPVLRLRKGQECAHRLRYLS